MIDFFDIQRFSDSRTYPITHLFTYGSGSTTLTDFILGLDTLKITGASYATLYSGSYFCIYVGGSNTQATEIVRIYNPSHRNVSIIGTYNYGADNNSTTSGGNSNSDSGIIYLTNDDDTYERAYANTSTYKVIYGLNGNDSIVDYSRYTNNATLLAEPVMIHFTKQVRILKVIFSMAETETII